MLNSLTIIGTKKSDTFDYDKKDSIYSYFLLECQRPFLESNGDLRTDTILVKVFKGIGNAIDEQYPVGTILAIKGRIEEKEKNLCYIVAEKVVFLNNEM